MRKQKVKFDNNTFLNVRVVFLLSALAHLMVTAVVTLNIDTTVDEDPRVKAYYFVRWKLITCWFNLIMLAYLPTRLYCEWRTNQGAGDSPLVTQLKQAGDVVMTGLLFPITVYSDIVFWTLHTWDPDLLAPSRLWIYLPYWAQHSLHTVSFFVVLLDLVLTPRQRPTSLKPRIALLLAFCSVYCWVIYRSYSDGELVYAVIEDMSMAQFTLTAVLSLGLILMLFTVQWAAIDFLWGKKPERKMA